MYGDDYDASEGTGIRDYIHIDDLARGHIAALDLTSGTTGAEVFNLGTRTGVSVLDLISAFERVNGQTIAKHITARRAGGVPIYLADPSRNKEVLGWKTVLDVDRICTNSLRFRSGNQTGSED